MTAPEPVEVAAGELATVLAKAIENLTVLTTCICDPALRWQSDWHADECCNYARVDVDALLAVLARALPVVEAAGAVVEQWEEIDVLTVRYMNPSFAELLDVLRGAMLVYGRGRRG